MVDKYGTGQDQECYPGTDTLINLLNIRDPAVLAEAERELTDVTATEIDFADPPYDLPYLQAIHRTLFNDLYPWGGELRQIDISKGETRFCTFSRIEPEAMRLFDGLAEANHYCNLALEELIVATAKLYTELNMVHPFREGNGRAQRILFEHIIVNCGWQISWEAIMPEEWVTANIAGVYADYSPMENIFSRCISESISYK